MVDSTAAETRQRQHPLLGDLSEVLFSSEEIETRVAELGRQIAADHPNGDVVLIGILKGAAYFLADLSRALHAPHSIEFMGTSSYGASTTSSGYVKVTKDLESDVSGRPVVIVEDIYDTGHTMHLLRDLLASHNPSSVRLCTMLYKDKPHDCEMEIDYIGFHCDDVFVVGYGLDYAERYRELQCIGILKPSVYQNG